jgi:hypothetical protein
MKQKIYEPVREFERATSYCPLYLAWRIVDEARDYFRTNWVPSPGSATRSHQMGEGLADKLAHRAEAVFAHHPSWQRRFKSARGREFILTSMRHWLAGVLARERPALFRDLPESFKVGHPLPDHSLIRPASAGHPLPSSGRGTGSYRRDDREQRTPRRCVPTRSKFVHGCELLAN